MNQTLKCYLRCFINYEQDNWAELLSCAKYACNQSVNATTGKAPFDVVLKYSPSMRINVAHEAPTGHILRENEAARERAARMEQAATASDEAFKTANEVMRKHADKKRKEMQFQEGDLVKLVAKYIRTLRVHKKLVERFLGPFKVLAKVGINAYKLDLPIKYKRLHHTFHIFLLEAYHVQEGCKPPELEDIDGVKEWEVEKILNK